MSRIILFKKTAGGLYEFELTYNATIGGGLLVSRYGLHNGSKTKYSTIATPKQVEAILKKKYQEGYKRLSMIGVTENYDNLNYTEVYGLLPEYITDPNNFVKICKCQPFAPGRFNYEPIAWAQPKINGNRNTISWGMTGTGLFQGKGVIIKSHEGINLNIKHVKDVFEIVFDSCSKDLVFDGEMYVRGEPVTSISGACKNPNNPIHKLLNYHCFDLAIPDLDQTARLELKTKALGTAAFQQRSIQDHKRGVLDSYNVINVFNKLIETDEEATEFRDLCIDNGYEGTVIRNGSATYKFGSRPKDLMKLKKAKFGIFEVVDINTFGFENSDNNIGKGINFVLRNDITNETFESKPVGLDVDQQMDMYINRKKVIGTKITLRYYERTVRNIPFHTNVII